MLPAGPLSARGVEPGSPACNLCSAAPLWKIKSEEKSVLTCSAHLVEMLSRSVASVVTLTR